MADAVFVDCTASKETGLRYKELLEAGYNIVSCNKIPFSGSLENYLELQKAAARCGCFLRFETTAGAALPLLETAERIRLSGDRLIRLQAILSGTLAYLCDRYDGAGFDSLLSDARAKGYTEPDPATDLSGTDVARKLLIIARKAGIPLREEDVRTEPFPDGTELEEFYRHARSEGKSLRYLAVLEQAGDCWTARASLQAVGPESPLYHLHGTDNCAVFTTADYPAGLVIRGAGAGARQTAGGVLFDIIS